MSKRLQVVVDEAELRSYQRAAKGSGLTLSAWVRLALRTAGKRESEGDLGHKLAAVRAAVQHEFPVADIEDMLAEIEAGRLGDPS